VGLTTLHYKNKLVTKTSKEPRTWTGFLDKRPKLWNVDMRVGTWNVRSFYRAGSLMTVSRELARYRMRWAGHVARMGEKRNAYRLILPVEPGPGVYSASNRNEYQKH
jgi:hypothetical protein